MQTKLGSVSPPPRLPPSTQSKAEILQLRKSIIQHFTSRLSPSLRSILAPPSTTRSPSSPGCFRRQPTAITTPPQAHVRTVDAHPAIHGWAEDHLSPVPHCSPQGPKDRNSGDRGRVLLDASQWLMGSAAMIVCGGGDCSSRLASTHV
jgi:hypothetical protein